MTISVVIPAFNAAETLGLQLDALQSQSLAEFEVVVADNRSTDDTAKVARAHSGSLDLRIVEAADRAGVSFARNVAVRASSGRSIVICDADDAVDEQWLEHMVTPLRQGTADIVGGMLSFHRFNDERTRRWRGADQVGPMMHRNFLPFAHGAAVGFNREVFDTVGGFDESLIGGGDDIDFSWRAQLAGFRLEAATEAIVHYRLRHDFRSVWRQMEAYGAADPALFRRFRAEGMQRRSTREVIRSLAWIAARAPRALSDDTARGVWLSAAGLQMGRIRGSFRERTLYL